jgi:hypothetical protein
MAKGPMACELIFAPCKFVMGSMTPWQICWDFCSRHLKKNHLVYRDSLGSVTSCRVHRLVMCYFVMYYSLSHMF